MARGLDLGTEYIIQVAEFDFNLGEKCCSLWLIAIKLVRLRRLQNAILVLTFVLTLICIQSLLCCGVLSLASSRV